MNKNLKGVGSALIVVSVIVLILFLLPNKYLPKPTITPTLAPEDTVTPTSTNTYFVAHINIDSPCRVGTSKEHEVITTIPQGRDVMVIGKDSDQADWLLVRWANFPDCWIEKKLVTTWDIESLAKIPSPSSSTLTPVSLPFTPTHIFTATPIKVLTFVTTQAGEISADIGFSTAVPIGTKTPTKSPVNPPNPPDPTNAPTNPTDPPTNPTDPPTNPTDTSKKDCVNPQGHPIPCH